MNKSKGFTLIELLAVVVILAILITLAITAVIPQINKSRKNAFVTDANTVLKAASNKFTDDRKTGIIVDDLYSSTKPGRVCYSVKNHLSTNYLNNIDSDIDGSVEVCYGSDCLYSSKIWLSNGKYFINGLEVVKSDKDVLEEITNDNYLQCGSNDEIEVPKDYIDFYYTETIQMYNIPEDGNYQIEVWGAEGGGSPVTFGGTGAYASGVATLKKNDKLYIVVGGSGENSISFNKKSSGGYNGGGNSNSNGDTYFAAGGGATHIALSSGLLKDVPSSDLIIVAAGGGGASSYSNQLNNGGSGGGAQGAQGSGSYRGYGGSQSSGGSGYSSNDLNKNGLYGQGAGVLDTTGISSGGGGGYYGGGSGFAYASSAGGGSSYINSSLITDGSIYCYKCPTSNNPVTYSTENIEKQPISQYAKVGHGHARIKLIK